MTAASTVSSRRPKKRHSQSLLPASTGGGFWWYLLPGSLLLTGVVLIPLVWNVYLSFTRYRGIRPPRWIGLENWTRLLSDEKFWTSFGNSVAMIVAMVVIPTLVGLVLAAMLFDLIGKKFGGGVASFLRATYYLPQILPAVIAAIVIGWILRPENGALNVILKAVGLRSPATQLARQPRYRAALHHGDHGLGAAGLPGRHLHGRPAAGEPRAI